MLTYRLQGPYCTQTSQLENHLCISHKNGPKATGVAGCFYGVGNHGGGPTIENIECIKRMLGRSRRADHRVRIA